MFQCPAIGNTNVIDAEACGTVITSDVLITHDTFSPMTSLSMILHDDIIARNVSM
jgi:hypothetical protein